MTFLGNCRATGIGSLPLEDPAAAVRVAFAACPDLPYWPQLTKRGRAEGMTEQASVGLPGLRITDDGRLRLVQDDAFLESLERLLAVYEQVTAESPTCDSPVGATGGLSASASGGEHWLQAASGTPAAAVAAFPAGSAAAFEPFCAAVAERAAAAPGPFDAKGQAAGPITVGMAILGEDGNPILYDDMLREVLVKFLHLRTRWQAARIAAAGARPVIFVDEPFLASYGTPYFGWSAGQVRETLEAVASGAEVVGSHCCSNTDWSLLLGSPHVGIVSFDAFTFAANFLVYRDAVAEFLSRGGNLAWGIVPTDSENLATVSVDLLREKLLAEVKKVEALGFAREQILSQSLITPACGLGTRDLATAERATGLVHDLAAVLQRDYLNM
jgi:hypothetical protein